jgi:ribosomal protein S6
MSRYEVLVLTVPEITQDESAALETNLGSLLKKEQGITLSFERWGKYRLAYPVKKNDYGVYFLTRFDIDNSTEALKALQTFFAVDQRALVMRYVVNALDPKTSLEYRRPPSLEETPAKEVGSFIRGERGERREGGRGGPRGAFSRGPRGRSGFDSRKQDGEYRQPVETPEIDESDIDQDMGEDA